MMQLKSAIHVFRTLGPDQDSDGGFDDDNADFLLEVQFARRIATTHQARCVVSYKSVTIVPEEYYDRCTGWLLAFDRLHAFFTTYRNQRIVPLFAHSRHNR